MPTKLRRFNALAAHLGMPFREIRQLSHGVTLKLIPGTRVQRIPGGAGYEVRPVVGFEDVYQYSKEECDELEAKASEGKAE
jgi:hypothetical protein